ncbi:hypothetical protein RclHR1_07040009 [Rhizophagus clarus]|uniref:Uncharacterized protein n=1 Tax=Rhizophagus clarus TaxID=94130 RepID=A0A2Z6RUR7_9GLOM|nr:hypothetical protein RclHR1_07040009 [Rhizophagus clarus]GES79624.1 hypothetical protein GLOIN_2v1595141 [Rhizophagus clarus]
MTDRDPYQEEEGIVKDEFYVQNEERGGDEYDPQKDMEEEAETEDNDVDVVEEDTADLEQNATIEPKRFRDSTYNITQKEGYYDENENETDVGGEVSEQSGRDRDASRQLSSLIAASHRKNRAPEKKRQSALKASELHEQITGHPLEISEDGEVQ